MTELICIVCPKGCRLHVDEENDCKVTGNQCLRGEEYGKIELTNPTRVITSTVRITGALHARAPVKTDIPIPKGMIFAAMRLLEDVELCSPVKTGDIAVAEIPGTAAHFVVTRDM